VIKEAGDKNLDKKIERWQFLFFFKVRWGKIKSFGSDCVVARFSVNRKLLNGLSF
jgi:hypothetical protein